MPAATPRRADDRRRLRLARQEEHEAVRRVDDHEHGGLLHIYEARDCQKWITEMKWPPTARRSSWVVGQQDLPHDIERDRSSSRLLDRGHQPAQQFHHAHGLLCQVGHLRAIAALSSATSRPTPACTYRLPRGSRTSDGEPDLRPRRGVQGCGLHRMTGLTSRLARPGNEYGNVVTAWGDTWQAQVVRYPTQHFGGVKKFRGHAATSSRSGGQAGTRTSSALAPRTRASSFGATRLTTMP